MSEFNKEFRYWVFKRKHLTADQDHELNALSLRYSLPSLECVIVESDWPNYQQTWRDIESISNGCPTTDAKYAAVCQELEEAQREIDHYKQQLDLVCEEGCTPADAKKLHEANAGLATESFNLKARIEEMSELCLTNAEVDKIKAEAIREATFKLEFDNHVMVCSSSSLMEYANKLEAES